MPGKSAVQFIFFLGSLNAGALLADQVKHSLWPGRFMRFGSFGWVEQIPFVLGAGAFLALLVLRSLSWKVGRVWLRAGLTVVFGMACSLATSLIDLAESHGPTGVPKPMFPESLAIALFLGLCVVSAEAVSRASAPSGVHASGGLEKSEPRPSA